MKILVLGAGIIGVTTAYVLATRGYDVEVVDRAASCAGECSFSNGGQLSYSHAEPWANPNTLFKTLRWLFNDSAPLVMRPRMDIDMLKWGIKFLGNCRNSRAAANTVTLLRLGIYSRKKMADIISATSIEFAHNSGGILHIFSKQHDFDCAKRQVEYQSKFGCNSNIITPDEAILREPALSHSKENLIGAIHAHLDETGDANIFTTKLAEICQQEYGVKFHYNTTIRSINKNKDGKISHISTSKGEMTADKYVISLGSYSPIYLRKIGISVPIYPMKGYSITIKSNEYAPQISLTDQQSKVVYSPLGKKFRIAGTAEFAGYDDKVRKKRLTPIIETSQKIFPKIWEGDDTEISEWACLRPSTPDGPPIIGKTPYSNLFINTGHGTLGWTQAAASAFLLADALEGKETEISLNGIGLERFL